MLKSVKSTEVVQDNNKLSGLARFITALAGDLGVRDQLFLHCDVYKHVFSHE